VRLSIAALAIGAVASIAAVVIMTIAAELSKPTKDAFREATGHHWVTKGLIALGVYIVTVGAAQMLLAGRRENPVLSSLLVIAAALVGTALLFFFFVGRFVAD
jgi:cobalamin synthase